MELQGGHVMIGRLTASDLADRFGTPLYAYDEQVIRGRMGKLVQGIEYRPLEIYYSCKANSAVALMRLLRSLGTRLDACSPGDMTVALAAGFPESEISYVGHSMSDGEIESVAQSEAFFTADSLSQIERIGQISPGRQIGLRVNCNVVAGFHPHVQAGAHDSKFGVHPEQMDDVLALAQRFDLRILGLHSHIGSDILEFGPHLEVLEKLLDLGRRTSDLQFVNLGGGWGIPFLEEDKEYDIEEFGRQATERLKAESDHRGRQITLRLEPGAYLLMDAGVLITRVTELKPPTPTEDPQTPFFVCLDTSYNHVVSAVLYDTYRPIHVEGRAGHPAVGTYNVVGNLMQAGDVLARAHPLPRVEAGDILVIEKCGAYAAVRAPTFNERPRPAEVLVDGPTATLIRRAETEDDLIRLDLP